MPEWAAHVSQTAEALRLFPDRFQLLYRDDSVTPPIELYRIHRNDVKVADRAKLVALNTPKALADLSYRVVPPTVVDTSAFSIIAARSYDRRLPNSDELG